MANRNLRLPTPRVVEVRSPRQAAMVAAAPTGHYSVLSIGLPPASLRRALARTADKIHPHGLAVLETPPAYVSDARAYLEEQGFVTIAVEQRGRRGRHQVIGRRPLPPHDHPRLRSTTTVAPPPELLDVTYVVPVRNERRGLPALWQSLLAADNAMESRRDYVFVINGCDDGSEELLSRLVATRQLTARIIHSRPGIGAAWAAGIDAANHSTMIGKLDGDVTLLTNTLDMLEWQLLASLDAHVSYAEPMVSTGPCGFDEADHQPELLSQRLYYVSKACLHQASGLSSPRLMRRLRWARADDMFLSLWYVYHFGLDAIVRAEGTAVYSKGVTSLADVIAQSARARSEMSRLLECWPEFQLVELTLRQSVRPGAYASLLSQAESLAGRVSDWTRIESTK